MMLLLLSACLTLAPPSPPRPLPEVERVVFALTNQERARYRLPPLRDDEALDSIARGHSEDMLRRGFFSHTNPDRESPGDRMARLHRILIGEGGENIWSGSGYNANAVAEQIVADWMNSAGHRANILNAEYTHLGVGVAMEGAEIRATQNFDIVEAFLAVPAPRAIHSGTVLDLHTAPNPSGTMAAMFDLWSEESGKRVFGPAKVTGAAIDAPPGSYRLRFYFPKALGKYTIWRGPIVDVVR
jgi:hypothetical protein